MKTKARSVGGKGEKSPLGDPASELHVGTEKEKEKCEDNEWNKQKHIQKY